MTIDHGEPKKSRHFTITDTAYNHLKDIAHEARLSLSETIERLIRTTSPWEGNAVLSDGAFSLVEDHSIVSEIEDYEGFKAD